MIIHGISVQLYRKQMKINENQWKLMQTNRWKCMENRWKHLGNQCKIMKIDYNA